MRSVLELAKEVDKKQSELNRAKAELLAALAGTAPNGRNVRVSGYSQAPRAAPLRGPGSDSIAARALLLIQQAGPPGIARKALVDQLGSESAVHSALKKHASNNRIFNRDGRWVDSRFGGTPAQKTPVEVPRRGTASPKSKAPKATGAKGASK